MDSVDKFCSTNSLQTWFKRAIGDGVRGRPQPGVSDGKLTDGVDKLWMDFGVIHRLWIRCYSGSGANDGTGLNSRRGIQR